VIPDGKLRWRRSTKDLNPITSRVLSFMVYPKQIQFEVKVEL